jgi:predicted S18 family serine protease
MQQDAENLRREKMQLEVRINDLSNALERSLNSSRTSDEDRTKISQLEREIVSLSALERSAQEDNNRLKHSLDEEQNNSKKVLEDLNSEKLKYTELLEEVASLQNKIEEAKLREDIVPPPAPVDLNDDEIQNYVNSRISEEVDNIQSKVTDAENIIASLKQENERLQKELEATKESSSNASPAASAEELKSIMQDVYMKSCEIFVPSDEDDSSTYTSQDVIKRLKSVLKHVTNERNSK